ncbi:Anaphase-promoting complex subunit 7 [Hordeum vulgare]|nr:Anaphase-promoting complex subunit 7 [Hordeum vulgare]
MKVMHQSAKALKLVGDVHAISSTGREKARKFYKSAIRLEPGFLGATLALVDLHVAGGRNKEAVLLLERYLRQWADDSLHVKLAQIALRREKIGATARFLGISAASYPNLVEASCKNPLTCVNKTVNGSFDQPSNGGGDVYPVEPYESLSINQVLDAHWGVLDDEDVVVWFSTGYITIKDIVVTGMPIKIVGVAALTVLLPTLVSLPAYNLVLITVD